MQAGRRGRHGGDGRFALPLPCFSGGDIWPSRWRGVADLRPPVARRSSPGHVFPSLPAADRRSDGGVNMWISLPIHWLPPAAAALTALWLSACAHGGAGQPVEPAVPRSDRAVPAKDRPFPRLAAVPGRPSVRDGAEQDRTLGELAADRASAALIAAEIDGGDPGAAVRFAVGSADLDARALGLVDAIAESWRRRGGTIRVEAHGRAGPPARAEGHAADRGLPARRANAVAARLLRGGVPASSIAIGAVAPGVQSTGPPASSGAAETGRVEVYLSD